ncbi:MAG: DUF362 domain-containing protein [Candidatus Heimdallarchaeota archaeon]|nr:DUF362 domain-containing protein [Candidatus Heimdallarchaeota archaeon]
MKKTPVAIVKVENNDVEKAVRKAIDLLGGIKTILQPFDNVLLKPNLSLALDDPNMRNKVCTDPRVVEAVTKIIAEEGKKILIGDCSGANTIGGTHKALEKSGFMHLKELPDVSIRSLEQNGFVAAEIHGKLLSNANISRDVLGAEAIINLPKMKTHGLTVISGAMKNLYGTIVGGDKTRIHGFATNSKDFSQCLVDLYRFIKPKIVLNIMDAIIAMEGLGPSISGKAVTMNLILASVDAVALDTVAFQLMGYNTPEIIPPIRLAREQGLGEGKLENIRIIGEAIAKHKRKFKLPPTTRFIHLSFMKFSKIISFFAKAPKYTSGCIGCTTCVKSCPKGAIALKRTKKGLYKPSIDYNKCISCFACVELCPNGCFSTKSKYRSKIIWLSLLGALLLGAVITGIVLLCILL